MNKTQRGIKIILNSNLRVLAVVVFLALFIQQQNQANQEPLPKVNYEQLRERVLAKSHYFHGNYGILIKDLSTQQEISINSDKLFPSASLVKVPIMVSVFKANQQDVLKLDNKLTLLKKHKVPGGRLSRTKSGRKFSVLELVTRMVTESDNTATNMLVEALGFKRLNDDFIAFGLKHTDLKRNVLDLKSRDAGIENYTTPEDMCFILEKIYNKELISKSASQQMLEILEKQKIKDRIPRWLPHNTIIAHKTGSLKDTISDVGIVFAPEGDFIICALTSDITGRSSAKRFIGRIARQVFGFYK